MSRALVVLLLLTSILYGCSGSDFTVANADAAAPVDSTTALDTETTVNDGDPPDTYTPPPDSGCAELGHDSPDVFVDLTAPAGGKGTSGCPFQKLSDAAATPLGASARRVVHVAKGLYNEPSFLRVRPGETYRGEGGVAKLIGGAGSKCPGTDDTCVVLIDGGGRLENFWIEGAAHGVAMIGTSAAQPAMSGTTVRAASIAGIFVGGAGATLGPGVHADANDGSGVVMRGSGKLAIAGSGNTFDNNKGMFGTGGILMASGTLGIEGGTSANGNNNGVLFQAAGATPSEHTISQLTAQSNRNAGLAINPGWGKITVRRSTFTKNLSYGVQAALVDGGLDLGDPAMVGQNVFGGLTGKNAKVGIFLCSSGDTGSVKAEGNKWSTCPPLQVKATGCDAPPVTYVDVAYVPRAGAPDPIAASATCAVGP